MAQTCTDGVITVSSEYIDVAGETNTEMTTSGSLLPQLGPNDSDFDSDDSVMEPEEDERSAWQPPAPDAVAPLPQFKQKWKYERDAALPGVALNEGGFANGGASGQWRLATVRADESDGGPTGNGSEAEDPRPVSTAPHAQQLPELQTADGLSSVIPPLHTTSAERASRPNTENEAPDGPPRSTKGGKKGMAGKPIEPARPPFPP